jgi:hypothetical protein
VSGPEVTGKSSRMATWTHWIRLHVLVAGLMLVLLGSAIRCARSEDQPPANVAGLIDQLVDVSEIGFGYAGLSGGSEFLADARPATLGPLVIGSPQPQRSPVLEAIVRQGAAAVPALLEHLDD